MIEITKDSTNKDEKKMQFETLTKINLFNLTQDDLSKFFISIGEKPFRSGQLLKWIHQLGVTNFDLMTNFSLKLRQYLKDYTDNLLPKIAQHLISQDGTQKWLLQLSDNTVIETVFIPEKDRGTLCISTQVGCAMKCAFCATGKLGFTRNLTTAEIIGQVWLAIKSLNQQNNVDKVENVVDNSLDNLHNMNEDRLITNVVIMGMGEPLQNFTNVVKAIDIMRDDFAYGLSKYRVTLSSVGLVPEIEQLSKITDTALAISLHAPTNELRDKLLPINKKYPLEQLMPVCKAFYKDHRRKVTYEYIMIDGLNDSPEHARQLIKLMGSHRCKVNLIPCNSVAGSPYKPSKQHKLDLFRDILMSANINTVTRKTRGNDIMAACGQLAGKKKEYDNE